MKNILINNKLIIEANINGYATYDLKNKKFKHENIAQLNTYVGYYKDNMRRTSDNEPIGILLCTNKSDEFVRYATAGMDNKLFVSQYLIELPKNEEWERFVKQMNLLAESGRSINKE